MSETVSIEKVARAYGTVKNTFSLDFNLKKEQLQGLTALVNGRDGLFVLPTGFGKTLIFVILPLVLDELNGCHNRCVVVSPLISLMRTMSKKYRAFGIKIFTSEELLSPDIYVGMNGFHLHTYFHGRLIIFYNLTNQEVLIYILQSFPLVH